MYQLRGKKNLADSVAIYGRGRELFRPPTYIHSLQDKWIKPSESHLKQGTSLCKKHNFKVL